MIIYEHTTVLARLIQWKGTVLIDTFGHVIMCNLVTLGVWAFVRADGVPHWEDRPDWVPGPVPVHEMSPLAWQLLMLPLGFLLGLRSNQAYGEHRANDLYTHTRAQTLQPTYAVCLLCVGRFLHGVDAFAQLLRCGGELCRQASSYIKTDVRTNKEEGEPDWQYRHPPPGERPVPGNEDYRDEQKERIFRHVCAFVALVRQDIRNKRLNTPASEEDMRKRATEERLHVTQEEMDYLISEGVYDEDMNAPFIVARWLSHDIAAVTHRIVIPTLIAAMEANVGEMVAAVRERRSGSRSTLTVVI